jgi:hypothetical protein
MAVLLAAHSRGIEAGLPPETRWADPSWVDLDVEFPGDGYHANWELFRCPCGDLLVRSELNVPGEVDSGETLLVGGKAVLSRGFGGREAELGASLDAPALMMQLALRLLERSAPDGPARVVERLQVDVEDAINHINLDTGAAAGGFKAPWAVEGWIEPVGETQRRFDLRFVFTIGAGSEAQRSSMRLYGTAEFAATEFPVSGDASLAEWQLSWRYEDDALPAKPATLARLRTLLKEPEGGP